MYHLNPNQIIIMYYGTKMKSEAGQSQVHTISKQHSKDTLVARPLLTPFAQELCSREHDVCAGRTLCSFSNSTSQRIFCRCSLSIFSNAHPEK
jgi:hypothetical protein